MPSRIQKKSARIQIQLDASLNKQLDRAARSCGITKSAFIRVALERELNLEKELARACARSAGFPEIDI